MRAILLTGVGLAGLAISGWALRVRLRPRARFYRTSMVTRAAAKGKRVQTPRKHIPSPDASAAFLRFRVPISSASLSFMTSLELIYDGFLPQVLLRVG